MGQAFALAWQSWYYSIVMSSDRIKNAMDRIDRALARIETQAALSSHSLSTNDANGTELAARHEALRSQVSASIAELDALIEGLER